MMRTVELVGWLATRLANPDLLELQSPGATATASPTSWWPRPWVDMLDLWNAPLDELLARLPERARRAAAPPLRPVPVRAEPKVGRNKPCPCGSGKKRKKCCDRPDARPDPASTSRADRLHARAHPRAPRSIS